MLSQLLKILIEPLLIEPFNPLRYLKVEITALFLKDALIGRLLCEGVLEGIFSLRKCPLLVNQIAALELAEIVIEPFSRAASDDPAGDT